MTKQTEEELKEKALKRYGVFHAYSDRPAFEAEERKKKNREMKRFVETKIEDKELSKSLIEIKYKRVLNLIVEINKLNNEVKKLAKEANISVEELRNMGTKINEEYLNEITKQNE